MLALVIFWASLNPISNEGWSSHVLLCLCLGEGALCLLSYVSDISPISHLELLECYYTRNRSEIYGEDVGTMAT